MVVLENLMTSLKSLDWLAFGQRIFWWLLAGIFIYMLLQLLLPRITRHVRGEIDDVLVAMVKWPALILIIAEGLIQAIPLLGLSSSANITAIRILRLVLIWVFAFLLLKIGNDIIRFYSDNYARQTESTLDDVLLPIINAVGPVVTVLLAVFATIAWAFEIDIMLFIGVLGGLSFILALIFQDLLGNLFAGAYLLVGRPFRPHDFIKLEDDKIYKVIRIGLRTTELYDINLHTVVYIPNITLAAQKIANITKPNVELKVTVDVSVAYSTDLDQLNLEELLKRLTRAHSHIIERLDAKLVALASLEPVCRSSIFSMFDIFESEGWPPYYHIYLTRIRQSFEGGLNGEEIYSPDIYPHDKKLMIFRWFVDHLLREDIERFSRQLFLVANWTNLRGEVDGWTRAEKEEFALRLEPCERNFESVRRILSLWLQIIQIETLLYELDLPDELLTAPDGMAASITRMASILERVPSCKEQKVKEGQVYLIGTHKPSSVECYLSIPKLALLVPQGADAWPINGEAESLYQDWLMDMPYATQFEDYQELYQRYHELVCRTDKKLEYWRSGRWQRVGREMRLDSEIMELRDLLDQFPTPIPRWKRPDITFYNFGASSLDLHLEFDIDDIVGEHFGREDDTVTEIRSAIIAEFASHQIEIPFPQQDVWFRTKLMLEDREDQEALKMAS